MITIAIPTLDRGIVLLETLAVLRRDQEVGEILIVDQTPAHPEEVERQLGNLNENGAIRWIRLPTPSIPHAMNVALQEASGEIVLFLDDDVLPGEGLVRSHLVNYADEGVVAVAGQVIQPWQRSEPIPRPKHRPGIDVDLDFPFNSTTRAEVRNCIGCNFSVRREAALATGGFDENFIGAAYRFETEFARRLTRHYGRIVFDPSASVRHLKAPKGGVRVYGDGATKSRIEHSVGSYYFAFLEAAGLERLRFMSRVLFQSTANRYYLNRPWEIPEHFVCQWRSLALARRLYRTRRGVSRQDQDTIVTNRTQSGTREQLLAKKGPPDR